jgi:hypothetical protein
MKAQYVGNTDADFMVDNKPMMRDDFYALLVNSAKFIPKIAQRIIDVMPQVPGVITIVNDPKPGAIGNGILVGYVALLKSPRGETLRRIEARTPFLPSEV